nr:protein TIFY 4B-like isoform X2 [Ipomoea batatas]
MPPESDVISPVEAVSKSLLDKPLNQLTDDDISQLTREDCRRYLKEKGMRRPSWNKSQAIQQVISLKALLEMPPDSDSGGYKKLYAPRSPSNSNNHESRVSKETDIDAEISESAEVMPFRGKNLEKTDLFGDLPAHPVGAVKDSAPSRSTESTCIPARQMAIFYCGKVNVYDDVPAHKAHTLLHFAGSTLPVPPDSPYDGAVTAQHSVCHLQAANVKVCQEYAVPLSPAVQTVEGPTSRKASVQRYLEKRKDRYS